MAVDILDVAATTLENRTRRLADNVTKNNGILRELSRNGRIRTVDGGEEIWQELEYAENQTYKRYSGYEVLNIAPSQTFSSARYDWKQIAVAVSMSGLETVQNAGRSRQIDLLRARISNAEKTMSNGVSGDLYSDGTADGGKQIGGLQLLVPDDPTTGTAGGFNRATETWWRSQVQSIATVTSSNIQSQMNQLWLKCTRGMDTPSLIVADNNYYTAYEESLQQIQRVTTAQRADAGYGTLTYKGKPVVFDGGQGGQCPTNHMYFLNSDYIYYRPSSNRNMVVVGGRRYSTNQDAFVQLLLWAGNMTMSNGSLQGVLIQTG